VHISDIDRSRKEIRDRFHFRWFIKMELQSIVKAYPQLQISRYVDRFVKRIALSFLSPQMPGDSGTCLISITPWRERNSGSRRELGASCNVRCDAKGLCLKLFAFLRRQWQVRWSMIKISDGLDARSSSSRPVQRLIRSPEPYFAGRRTPRPRCQSMPSHPDGTSDGEPSRTTRDRGHHRGQCP
jgi:hypothetical protein